MTKRRIWRLLALLFAFSLIAAACGGDDDADEGDDEVATEATAAPSAEMMEEEEEEVGGAAADDLEAAVAGEELEEDEAEEEMMVEIGDCDVMIPAFDPASVDRTSIETLFASAAERRAEIVNALSAAHVDNGGNCGVGEDGILRGPAGFTIDMNECPADWSNTTGITGSEVRIGHTTAQSGTLAAYGAIAYGWENYLDWVNENDPIMVNDSARNLTLLVRDDAYVAASTIEFVNELIQDGNVFSILTLGSPNTLAVYGTLNEECIPQPFVMTGHPAWGDPDNYPWTTGLQLSYSTEAILWGSWIKENLADQLPVKVAGLVMDNDFGLAYELGFHEWAERNPDVVSEFVPVRHDPAAPTLTNEMTNVKAENPHVFISMTAGAPCVQGITEAAANGLIDDINDKGGALFMPSVCKAVRNYMEPGGEASDNWMIVGGGIKDTTDAQYTSEPFIAWLNETLAAGDLDPSNSLNGTGYMYGYPYVEALRIGADLPGGLNRTNFILAVRSISIYHPLALDGITAEMYGSADSYFIEGSDFSQFDYATQTWQIVGDIVDVNGRSANCEWVPGEGC